MIFKKLELQGFKTFFDRTEVHFRPGINAVVGPNGCGKSNIADAIRWVLGEQSPKQLRGERMEDLIVPFRSFWVYHPRQRGNCSLKSVLPALTDFGYDELAIADGNHAARQYQQALYGNVAVKERATIFNNLREYCKLDTMAMVAILSRLEKLVQ